MKKTPLGEVLDELIPKDQAYYINELIMNVKVRHKLMDKLIEYRENYTGKEKDLSEFGKSPIDFVMYLNEELEKGTLDTKSLRWWED